MCPLVPLRFAKVISPREIPVKRHVRIPKLVVKLVPQPSLSKRPHNLVPRNEHQGLRTLPHLSRLSSRVVPVNLLSDRRPRHLRADIPKRKRVIPPLILERIVPPVHFEL